MAIDATKIQKIADFNKKQADKNTKLTLDRREGKNDNTIPKPPPPPGMSKEELIAAKALETEAVRKAKAQEEADRKKKEEEDAALLEKSRLQVQKATEALKAATEEPRKWIERLPTPGGIATILIILLFFLFAVIPVDSSGNTRLKLFWLSLRGNTHLAYTEQTSTTDQPKEVIPPPGQASGKKEEPLPVDLSMYRGVDFSLIDLFS